MAETTANSGGVSQNQNTPPAQNTPPPVPDCLVQKDGVWHMKGIVNGKETILPVNEVQVRLQKDVASEQRFAEAAAKEAAAAKTAEQNATAIKFWELTNRSEAGDRLATEEALRMINRDPQVYMGANRNAPANQQPVEPSPELKQAAAVIKAAEAEGIDPLVALRFAHESAAGAIRQQVFATVENSAALDSVLGPILKNTKDETLANVVRADLQRQVKYLVGVEGAEPGPATYARAVRETSERIKQIRGTQASPHSQVPGNTYPGLGPASSGVPNETVDLTKPVSFKSIVSHGMDGWVGNFQERLRRNAALQGVSVT